MESVLNKSQSGTKLLLPSVQVRVALLTMEFAGLFDRSKSSEKFPPSSYRPTDALIAVLPLPNRSYAPPSRGWIFFQLGMSSCSGNVIAGTYLPAGRVCAGAYALIESNLTPRFSV